MMRLPDMPGVGRMAAYLRVVRRMRRGEPTFLGFNVTNRCNERCPMCNVWRSSADELGLNEMARILYDLRGFGIAVIEITGGEPFLRPDLPQIFELFDRLGFLYSLTTNGTLCDDAILGSLRRAKGLIQFAVSLDSLDPGRYAMLRGRDALPAVLDNLERFREARLGVPLKLNLTMSTVNCDETMHLLDFARSRGMYLSVFPANIGKERMHSHEAPALAADAGQRRRMADIFRELARLRRAGEPLWEYSGFYELAADYLLGNSVGPCDAGCLYLDLHADGRLAVCLEHEDFADLRAERVADAWTRIADELRRVEECHRCSPCCYTCTYNISVTARHLTEFILETLHVRLKRWWHGCRGNMFSSGKSG